ncbi:ADP-ribosylation factor-like protein 6-interacting protein 4 [Agrilus planipennis]|uniref:ADP-ribosylation factor-like protein 6-interacting protein 4 n=1 Tax=Agrilus planipennis TaxID=224129 RepID=A0A1W4WP91_AGRPL|nr:ADP-ribosylation factor-like protein 6-interacting protein 4 [Agrilus planipennis]
MSKKSKKDKQKKSKKYSKYKSKERHNPSNSKEASNSNSVKHHKRKKKHTKEHKTDIKNKNDHNTNVKGEEMDVPLALMDKPANDMTPMTKEQWEKRQSIVRRVYDEASGRHRLIKGDGEVVEEIVSRERHLAINKTATKGDQEYFQAKVLSNLK